MRTHTSLLLAGAGFVIAVGSAHLASADTVPFASLPVIAAAPSASATPAPAPSTIASAEHADGVFPALLPMARRKSTEDNGYRYVAVFPTDKEAVAYTNDGSISTSSTRDPSTRTCLSTGGNDSPYLSLYVRTKPYVQPKPSAQMIATLKRLHRWPPPPVKVSKEPMKDTIVRLHTERLAQSADAVTLDTNEAFLDLNTMGARLTSRSSTKLSKVSTGPNNLTVYAARDDQGNTQFLVTNPQLPPTASDEDRQAQLDQLSDTANRLVAQMPTGFSAETGCGYLRFSLAAKPGTGQMATVLATAFLPPGSDPDGNDEPDMSRFENEGMNEEQLKQVKAELHRENRSQRARTVAVSVSLSQLASEASPLLSVTFGWASRDEQLRF
jgi:hypothetical protein